MKTLLSLAVAALTAFSATAATETFAVATAEFWGVTAPETSGSGVDLEATTGSVTQNDVTFAWDKGSATYFRLWNASGTLQWRIYKNSTFTVSSASGVVTEVALSLKSGVFSSSDGVTINTSNSTWTGSAQSVTFTVTTNAQVLELTVTTGEATGISTPVISGTTPFLGSTEVSISCDTEGASLYYTTDGTDPTSASTPYTAPFTISESCTVKAVAVVNGVSSAVASKEFVAQTSVSTLAAYEALEDGTEFVYTGEAVVSGQSGNYLYAQDATAGVLIYGSVGQTYSFGDVIPANWSGTKTTYNGAPEVTGPADFAASTSTATLEAVEVTPSTISAQLHKYIVIKNATVDATNNTVTVGSESVAMYFRFSDVTAPTDENAYDVYAIAGYYNADQILPLSFVASSSSGINEINVENTRVYKTIENGQVIIVNGDVRYNTMGQRLN